MKYLILIHRNPRSRELWEGFSEEQQAQGYEAYAALDEELRASGELIVSEALADPSTGKRVRVENGRVMATDGPFAEVKEELAGIYLVDCESVERAVEIAGRIPGADYLSVEVRPVLDLGAFDL
jgi:hypothetical protein